MTESQKGYGYDGRDLEPGELTAAGDGPFAALHPEGESLLFGLTTPEGMARYRAAREALANPPPAPVSDGTMPPLTNLARIGICIGQLSICLPVGIVFMVLIDRYGGPPHGPMSAPEVLTFLALSTLFAWPFCAWAAGLAGDGSHKVARDPWLFGFNLYFRFPVVCVVAAVSWGVWLAIIIAALVIGGWLVGKLFHHF